MTLVTYSGTTKTIYVYLTILKNNWVAFKWQIKSKGGYRSFTGLTARQGQQDTIT